MQIVGPGSKEVLTFSFDYVFGENSAQRQVYEVTARDTVLDMLDGYNGTIFAYGQTGAGKTFTMTSNLDGAPETRGIIPRACSQLFSHIEQDNSGTEFTIKCSFLEIYRETLRDLLDPKSTTKLKIRETPTKGVWVEGLTEAFVSSQQDIFALLRLGEQSRTTAATNMNSVSSRSHSLFVITLVQKLKDGSTKLSRLNLADLAGSEKVGKTGATGETLEEAKKINQSLSALGNCIVALTKAPEKRKHVPYRDSKLTFILRESLGGNSKTTLMIACSPHLYNLEETLSTLRFGQRAKSIKNQVKINAHRSVQELEMIVTKLQSEVARLRAYSRTLEQELITRLPNETIDLQALQEKAWKTLKPEVSDKPEKSEKSDLKPRVTPSISASGNTLTPPTAHHATPTRTKRALSGSTDSAPVSSAPMPRPRSRADSERVEHSSSPSSSLSFMTDSVSDGTRSPPSEADSDFWTPMNLVEAQIAYDRMKEELEFKLQDALEELAQAKDESGIDSLKSQLRSEFEEYKVQHDAKLVEVQKLASELMAKIVSATEQAEDLAEQLAQTAEERDKAVANIAVISTERDSLVGEHSTLETRFKSLEEGKENDVSNLSRSLEALTLEKSTLQTELADLKAYLSKTQTDLEKKLTETEARLSTEKSTLAVSLAEQQSIVAAKSKQLEEALVNVTRLTSDLDHAIETRTLLKSQTASLTLEVESLRTSVAAKEGQLVEATSSVRKLETKMQDYIAEASGEGLKVLGDLNKSLTDKNQQLFEEKNALMAKSSELQLKLDIATNELDTKKTQKDADNARLSALEADLATIKSELEQSKISGAKRIHELELRLETDAAHLRSEMEQERTASTRKSHALELQLKEVEMAVVEEKRLTLQSQLAVEKAHVETEVARTDNVKIRADLEKEMIALGAKWNEEKRSLEAAVASKATLITSQTSQLAELGELSSSLKTQLAELDAIAKRREVESRIADETSVKRIQSLEEDLTDARVSLRRAREEIEGLRDERLQLSSEMETLNAAHANVQSELASYALKTPSKPQSSIVGRDPTQMMRSMDSHLKTPSLNSRIAVPVSQSMLSHAYASGSSTSGLASGMLKNGSNGNVANIARPAKVASSILNTPSLNHAATERTSELSAWLNVCTCIGGKAMYSSGWRRLWVVVKDRKVVCYENQEQRTIVEAVQLRGCQIYQLPDVTRTLVDQPTDFAFVLISNPDDLSAALNAADGEDASSTMHHEQQQDEFAFAAPSRELLDSYVQNLIKSDCEPLAFTTLRLETIQAPPVQAKSTPSSSNSANNTPKHTSAFSKLGGATSASQSTPAAPKSFLSGLFG